MSTNRAVSSLGTSSFDLNRFDVHLLGPEFAIQRLERFIVKLANDPINLDTLCELYKSAGIYYAFYNPDRKLAVDYFDKHKSLLNKQDEPLLYADACNLLGYAQALDEDCIDESLFIEALKVYEGVVATHPTHFEANLGPCFAMRMITLMNFRHRFTLRADSNETIQDNLNTALAKIQSILSITQQLFDDINKHAPHSAKKILVLLELIEATKLEGIIQQECKNFSGAEKALERSYAAALMLSQCSGGASPYFFRVIQHKAKLSLAQATTALEKNPASNLANIYLDSAEGLVADIRAAQEAYFKTPLHPDILNTELIQGDIFSARRNPQKALLAYLNAYEIAKKIPNSPNLEDLQSNIDKTLATFERHHFKWLETHRIEVIRALLAVFPYDPNTASYDWINDHDHLANTILELIFCESIDTIESWDETQRDSTTFAIARAVAKDPGAGILLNKLFLHLGCFYLHANNDGERGRRYLLMAKGLKQAPEDCPEEGFVPHLRYQAQDYWIESHIGYAHLWLFKDVLASQEGDWLERADFHASLGTGFCESVILRYKNSKILEEISIAVFAYYVLANIAFELAKVNRYKHDRYIKVGYQHYESALQLCQDNNITDHQYYKICSELGSRFTNDKNINRAKDTLNLANDYWKKIQAENPIESADYISHLIYVGDYLQLKNDLKEAIARYQAAAKILEDYKWEHERLAIVNQKILYLQNRLAESSATAVPEPIAQQLGTSMMAALNDKKSPAAAPSYAFGAEAVSPKHRHI